MSTDRPREKRDAKPNRAGNRRKGAIGRSGSERGEQWLYGFHAVREALRANRRAMHRLWVRTGAAREEDERLISLAEERSVVVERVERERLDGCAGEGAQTQGVALEVGPIPEVGLKELLERAEARGDAGSRIVALDGVEDPQNVGALIRVAESAGATGLILTDRRAPALTPTVARASAGALEWLPVARVTNLSRALSECQAAGHWVIAAALEDAESLHEMEDRLLSGQMVVVLGAEGRGVRPAVLKAADHRVKIPMLGEIDSLNVSTAGAVILYDLLRRAGPSEA